MIAFTVQDIHKIIFCILDETDLKEEDLYDLDGIKKESQSVCVKTEREANVSGTNDKKEGQATVPKVEKDQAKEAQRNKEMKINESEVIRDLKNQLK